MSYLDFTLEKVFPYEGIPEIILSFFSPEETHEKGSEKCREILEQKYKTVLDNQTYFNGKLHSFNDESAGMRTSEWWKWNVVHPAWFRYGVHHRDGDRPAIIYIHNNLDEKIRRKEWWKNGKLHREGKPAQIFADGTQIWWKNGKLHRDDDKPAVISLDKEEWWFKGKKHRDGDNPAVVIKKGVFTNGNKQEWWFHGELHRDGDKPAIIERSGSIQEWWVHGQRHRDGDKPAVIERSGIQEWWVRGKRHREGNKPVIVKNFK